MSLGPLLEPKPASENQLARFVKKEVRASKAYSIETLSNLPPSKALIKLDQNENFLPWPKELRSRVLARLTSANWNRYPSPFPVDLEARMAHYHGLTQGSVMMSDGSSSLIDLLFAVMSSSTPWVILRPSFVLFESRARLHGVPFLSWPLDSGGDFSLDHLPQLTPGSKVIFASPNNPTGSVIPASMLRHLLQTYPDCLFICDAAYQEYLPESYTSLLKDHSHLLILRTLAKSYSSAGIRLGYIMGSQAFLSELRKHQLPFSCNHFCYAALEELLIPPYHHLSEMRAAARKLASHRDEISQSLRSYVSSSYISDTGFYIYPSGANFLLLSWTSIPECMRFYEDLKQQGIIIRNLSGLMGMKGALRLTTGSPEENQAFLVAAQNSFRSWSALSHASP